MGTHRLVCQFCSMQDPLFLDFEDVFSTAYFGKNGFVQGQYETGDRRICPRGNFCIELAQHKLRTTYSRIDGQKVSSEDALREIEQRTFSIDRKRISIILSGSLPLEEAYLATKLAKAYETRLVAQIFPEDYISARFLNRFSFDDIKNQQLILAIGDVFSLHPSIAKVVHDTRFASRRNVFSVIDDTATRTSRFSWAFLKANHGSVADVVEALSKAVSGEEFSIDRTGVNKALFDQLVGIIKKTEKGMVLFSPGIGSFSEPMRIGFSAKKLADSAKFGFAAFGIGSNGRGISRLLSAMGFATIGEVLKAISDGKVDALLCLGCDPIESFPNLYEHIRKIPLIIATTILPTAIYESANITVPSLTIFERKGTLLSLEEKLVKLDDCLPAPDYPAESSVLSKLLSSLDIDAEAPIVDIKKNLDEFDFAAESPEPQPDVREVRLVAKGYNPAHHHGDGSITRRATWVKRYAETTDNSVIIGPKLARSLLVKNGDSVFVQTNNGQSEFVVSIEEDQPDGVILVPSFMPQGRALLGFCPESGFIPVSAEIKKV